MQKGLLALARSPPGERRQQAPLPLWLSFGSTQRGVCDPAASGEALIRPLLSRPLASLDVSDQRRLFACTPRLTRCEFGAAANIFRASLEVNGPFGPTPARCKRVPGVVDAAEGSGPSGGLAPAGRPDGVRWGTGTSGELRRREAGGNRTPGGLCAVVLVEQVQTDAQGALRAPE